VFGKYLEKVYIVAKQDGKNTSLKKKDGKNIMKNRQWNRLKNASKHVRGFSHKK
jgi:hypothetical protein